MTFLDVANAALMEATRQTSSGSEQLHRQRMAEMSNRRKFMQIQQMPVAHGRPWLRSVTGVVTRLFKSGPASGPVAIETSCADENKNYVNSDDYGKIARRNPMWRG